MSQAPTFYIPANIYFNGLSGSMVPTLVPWVPTFESSPSGSDAVVLTTNFGADAPGLYVKITDAATGRPFWKFVLPLSALASVLATSSALSIIVNASATTTFAAPNVVYANGQVVSGGVITASTTTVYVVAAPSTTAGSAYTVATLPSAATAGVGARSFVSDATVNTFGTTVVGSGTIKVPVYSDGTNWKIG